MRGVIVVNEDRVTVRVVRPSVPPVERTPDHDDGKNNGKPSLQKTTA